MPVFRLGKQLVFPPIEFAEDGLIAIGGDLSVERLILAYRSGIFPWYSKGDPILWWSPDPRMVLYPKKLHRSRSLKRTLKKRVFRIAMDTAFETVIRECAKAPRPGQDGTWITTDMIDAYIALHKAGYAHSVEAWRGGKLAGGLYGISLGAAFFGESMFSAEPDASKVALATAIDHFLDWGIQLIDCQVANPHLRRLGGESIPRKQFIKELGNALEAPTRRGAWTADGE